MKSKSIVKEFFKYIQSSPDSFDRSLANAMLYGADEFKVDYKRKQLKVNGLGWIPCDGLTDQDNPEWLILSNIGDKVIIDLGRGNPYSTYKNGYSYRNVQFNLVPYCTTIK